MSNIAYINEEFLPPALYEKPPFLSKRAIQCNAGAMLISAVALAAIALYIQPFAAVITGVCMAAIAGICLIKKGMTYYAQITRDSQRADRALTTHIEILKRDIRALMENSQQLDRDVNNVSDGDVSDDDALSALVKVLKAKGAISDKEAEDALIGPSMRFSSTFSTHFVERFIVPCISCLARAKKCADEAYAEHQNRHAVLSKRSHDLNVLFARGREVLGIKN